jgi:thiosulfate/3-mercaptopyruvate sulfurtransferase
MRASPEKLVSTDWVAENINNSNIRLIESNEDQLLYASGHIPGAVEVDWVRDLNDPLQRDYLNAEQFQELASTLGITPGTRLIFYGDRNNWWAAYALWVFELFGHTNSALMDGGSLKWKKENRALSREKPKLQPTDYPFTERDDTIVRSFRDDVLQGISSRGVQLVDVRSPEEYSGERLHMPDYPNEGALRGGHIPGAKSIPWAKSVDPSDGTFLSNGELEKLYIRDAGCNKELPVIAYCRIGERSSHTWFVLKYLLGFSDVKNYDGSWTEWGNSVGLPIER